MLNRQNVKGWNDPEVSTLIDMAYDALEGAEDMIKEINERYPEADLLTIVACAFEKGEQNGYTRCSEGG